MTRHPANSLPSASVRVTSLTGESLAQVADVHLDAFPGYLSSQLGRGYLRALLRWFLGRNDAVALVALGDSGEVLGYAVGAPPASGREMNRALIPSACLAMASKPWLLLSPPMRHTAWRRIQSTFGWNGAVNPKPPLPMPTLSLVSIGVVPRARGRGAGEQLIQAWEAGARRMGFASLRLSVFVENSGARRFYEKHGWVPFQESVLEGHSMYYFKLF